MEKFTAVEQELIQRHVVRVWSDVGGDILMAVADEKGKGVEQVTVSRADVIEICLDADRPEELMRRDAKISAELLARWDALDYAAKIKLVKPAFSYARYGM